jgi:hypothetical protein
MTTCPCCGAPNDAANCFCGQCGDTLTVPNRATAAGPPPPRKLAGYLAAVGLLLLVMWGSGLSPWLAVQIRDEVMPSLARVSPFGLIQAFDRGMRCDDFRLSWSGVDCSSDLRHWELKPAKVLVAFADTISQTLHAGWPVWVLVFPPLGVGVALWQRLRLPFSSNLPAALLLGVPARLLGCGVVSWAVRLLLVFFILPVVAQFLVLCGFAGALYAKWSSISGVLDDLRTAHRLAKAASGLPGRS